MIMSMSMCLFDAVVKKKIIIIENRIRNSIKRSIYPELWETLEGVGAAVALAVVGGTKVEVVKALGVVEDERWVLLDFGLVVEGMPGVVPAVVVFFGVVVGLVVETVDAFVVVVLGLEVVLTVVVLDVVVGLMVVVVLAVVVVVAGLVDVVLTVVLVDGLVVVFEVMGLVVVFLDVVVLDVVVVVFLTVVVDGVVIVGLRVVLDVVVGLTDEVVVRAVVLVVAVEAVGFLVVWASCFVPHQI
jgi:hypothetical protein